MSASGRPLYPAQSARSSSIEQDASSKQDPNHPSNPNRKTKRTLIESACSACRKRKSKCDGARPTCSRCLALATECVYDAEEGESRWSALRRQNGVLERECRVLRETLHFLQAAPEAEARDLLRRIRSEQNMPWERFAQLIHERGTATPIAPLASSSSNAAEPTRLPPISTMIEASELGNSMMASGTFRRQSLGSNGSAGSAGSMSSGHSAASAVRRPNAS